MRAPRGFTLIELLIVVVIIGIIASIAIPKFGAAREQAFISAMQSDLRNLQTAQELHYSTYDYAYAATLDELGFTPSQGVAIVLSGTADGWSAQASHPGTSATCEVFVGTGSGSIAQNEGMVTCSTGS